MSVPSPQPDRSSELPGLLEELIAKLPPEREPRELIQLVLDGKGENDEVPQQLDSVRRVIGYLKQLVESQQPGKASHERERDGLGPIHSVLALRDGVLGLTTYFVHFSIGDVFDGRSYLTIRRLITYLAAQLAAERALVPDLVRPDDVFLVGWAKACGPADSDEEQREDVAREQLYRLVTTMQANASLPSNLNLRFRFGEMPVATVREMEKAGLALLGHHLFGLRRLIAQRAKGASADDPSPGAPEESGSVPNLVEELRDRLSCGGLPNATLLEGRLLQITELEVRAIRCFERMPVRMNLYPLTFLVGGNAVGKSAVLDALALTVAKRIWPSGRAGDGEVLMQGLAPLSVFEEAGQAAARNMIGNRSFAAHQKGRTSEEQVLAEARGIVETDPDTENKAGHRNDHPPMGDVTFATWFLHQELLLDAAVGGLDDRIQLMGALLGGELQRLRLQAQQAGASIDADEIASLVGELFGGPEPRQPELSRALALAFSEILMSIKAYEWRWDRYQVRFDERGRWSFSMDGRLTARYDPLTNTNAGNRELIHLASFLLHFCLAWSISSRVIVLDDPFSHIDRHNARSLASTLLRLRRYLECFALGREGQHVCAWGHEAEYRAQDEPTPYVIRELTSSSLNEGCMRDPRLRGQLLLTCADRDLALEVLESEAFPMLARLKPLLAKLLPDACARWQLRAQVKKACEARSPEGQPWHSWSEIRWLLDCRRHECCRGANGCGGLQDSAEEAFPPFHTEQDARDYQLRVENALRRMGLRLAADAVGKFSEKNEEKRVPLQTSSQLAWAMCSWMLDWDLLPLLLGDIEDLERGNAGLLPLPPPLTKDPLPKPTEAAQMLYSERGRQALRICTIQEQALAAALETS